MTDDKLEAKREKARQRSKAWRAANPERYRQKVRQWDAAHPENVKERNHRWYAKQKQMEHFLRNFECFS